VKHQPSFYFITIREARALRRPHSVLWLLLTGSLLFRLAEAVSSAGQFLDGAALLEL